MVVEKEIDKIGRTERLKEQNEDGATSRTGSGMSREVVEENDEIAEC
jgi:hypothetical protein